MRLWESVLRQTIDMSGCLEFGSKVLGINPQIIIILSRNILNSLIGMRGRGKQDG